MIACTTRTIDKRAKYLRNLMVAVIVIGIGSIAWAGMTWAFRPLAGLLLLFPLCGLFLYLDGRLLHAWRSLIVDAWIKNDIDLQFFCEAVNAIPMLPKNTVGSMLTTLPMAGDLTAEQGMSSSTREALAVTVTGIHSWQSDIVALKATAAAIVAGSIIAAIVGHTWVPLLCTLAVIVLSVLGKWLKWRRVEVLKERAAIAREKPDFDGEKYSQLVAHLHLS